MNGNEFSEIMGFLEVNGLVSVKGGADERSRVIGLKCCREEISKGVDEKFQLLLSDLLPVSGGAKDN